MGASLIWVYYTGCTGNFRLIFSCISGNIEFVSIGIFQVTAALGFPAIWWLQHVSRRGGERVDGQQNSSVLAFFGCVYWFLGSVGFSDAVGFAAYYFHAAMDDLSLQSSLLISFSGLAMFVPTSCFILLGRGLIFSQVTRQFELEHAEIDGAFMAELLDSVSVEVGMTWWVHHGRNYTNYDTSDPLRNWTKGIVRELTGSAFVVELPNQVIVRQTISTAEATSNLSIRESVSATRSLVPLAATGMSSQNLVLSMRSTLRCIEWKNISVELLYSQFSGAPGGDITRLLDLSRLVGTEEHIDYFISHSWHDDAQKKFEVLSKAALNFSSKHKRDPTFWLDKVCIDQNAISDGLRLLPLNLVACNEVLVIAGETFASRLWCAWELCTLFAFSETAADRVRFMSTSGTDDAALQQLESFDVCGAHCYDPNEQARLMKVIGAVGVKAFNMRIRNYAGVIRTQYHHRLH